MTRKPLGADIVGVPFWVSVTVWPATVSCMVRAVAWPFAVTCSITVPLPVPLPPLVIETQFTFGLSAAVQVQPVWDETLMFTVPPDVPTLGVNGETV